MIAVSEAARNIVCSGGEPLAITNCLNFGNPYNPEVYWQFKEAVTGMGEACRKYDTPVTGGNVSFYNQASIEGKTEPVHPTPVIGMLGIVKEKQHMMSLDFKEKGDMIFLIGKSVNDLAGSQYLYSVKGIKKSPPPHFDLDYEYRIQQAVLGLIRGGLVRSAHDVSDGGLYVALVESAMPRDLGFDITSPAEVRKDAFLFGEAQSRVVVTVNQDEETEFIDYMMDQQLHFSALGHVTKGELRVDDASFGFISDVKKNYFSSLEDALED
jgi:phosphoribosylformylglycinamidine synthase